MTRFVLVVIATLVAARGSANQVRLDSPTTDAGYIALLLINETPFPGEAMWVSEADTKAGMLQILYVLDSRAHETPPGYLRRHISMTNSTDVIDIMTAGGERGQVDGFYRDDDGIPRTVPRVQERVDYLMRIANDGKPGRFARLMNYAQGLADAYADGGIEEADRFAGISSIGGTTVTGRGYAWMTDKNNYAPGGNYVRIPDSYDGGLGGNRFFTLRKLK